MRRVFYLAAAIALCALISACGFHLRGDVDLPQGVEPIGLGGSAVESSLGRELERVLRRGGVDVADSLLEARYQVLVLSQSRQRRTVTIGSGAESAEYRLIQTVSFEVRNTKGDRVLGPRTLREERVMLNDPNNPTGKAQEAQILYDEMVHGLATRIAGQLRTLAPEYGAG